MANDNLATIPQSWAKEGLMVLMENTPAAANVNRQYSSELARQGDQVNAYRANRRKTRRKTGTDGYTAADANTTAVPVLLDQYFYDSFIIQDDEMSLSVTDLRETHLVPAVQTIARGIDRAILGRIHAFLQQGSSDKRAGKLGGMTKTNSADYILAAEEVLNTNNAPPGVRTAIVHQTANTFLMGNELFARSDARGSSPAVLTGEVGRIYNTRVVMSQDVNFVYQPNADIQNATVNNSGGYAAGFATAMTVTDPGVDWTAGEYALLTDNGQPTYVSATGGPTSITLNEPLKYAVADTSAIVHFLKCTNEATARNPGYAKEMTFTHTSGKNLQAGQLMSFGLATRHTYTIIEIAATTATTTTVLLDRPLEVTVTSGQTTCFPGPSGGMNPVLDPNAIALVTRPLYQPPARYGVESVVENYRGIGLRVSTQYDSAAGGLRVNLDVLAGVSVLNDELLCAMLS